MSKKIKKNYGWVCPKCGRVNAPHIDACPCSEHKDYWIQPIYPDCPGPIYPDCPGDYWIYPNYPNDYLVPGTPSEDPKIKTTPSAIGPFVDSPNVIGPYVDDQFKNLINFL